MQNIYYLDYIENIDYRNLNTDSKLNIQSIYSHKGHMGSIWIPVYICLMIKSR